MGNRQMIQVYAKTGNFKPQPRTPTPGTPGPSQLYLYKLKLSRFEIIFTPGVVLNDFFAMSRDCIFETGKPD